MQIMSLWNIHWKLTFHLVQQTLKDDEKRSQYDKVHRNFCKIAWKKYALRWDLFICYPVILCVNLYLITLGLWSVIFLNSYIVHWTVGSWLALVKITCRTWRVETSKMVWVACHKHKCTIPINMQWIVPI